MSRAHVLLIAPAVVFLTSCQIAPVSSKKDAPQLSDRAVTERFVIYERTMNDGGPPEDPQVFIPPAISAQVPEACSPFVLPPSRKTPPIPIFEGWERNNLEVINAKLTRHIEELRGYISTYNTELDKAYMDYVKRCQIGGDSAKLK